MKNLRLGKKTPLILLNMLFMAYGEMIPSANAMEANADHPTQVLSVGDHRLEIYDKTGKFSVSHYEAMDAVLKEVNDSDDNQEIAFTPKFEGDEIKVLDYSIISPSLLEEVRDARAREEEKISEEEKSNDELADVYDAIETFFESVDKLTFYDSTEMRIEEIEKSVYQILETDTRQKTESTYFVKKHTDFEAYFQNIEAYNQKSQSNYIWIYYKPDSSYFIKHIVEVALKGKFLKYLSSKSLTEKVKENPNLRAFYNSHGIILNISRQPLSLDLLTLPQSESASEEKRSSGEEFGEVIFMKPSTKKVKTVEGQYNFFTEEKIIFCKARYMKPKFSLVVGSDDVAFLNSEPAKIIEAKELLELWG